jgi:glyoxylase-like metal-dependent hydrolase (beta-lactamase superfamily II)
MFLEEIVAIKEVRQNFFRVDVELLYIGHVHLRSLNAYMIRGGERNLIVGAEMNVECCMRAIESSLRQIGIDLDRTDLFITHIHLDHLQPEYAENLQVGRTF